MQSSDIKEVVLKSIRDAYDDEFRGYDPFDGLNAKRFKKVYAGTKFGRLAFLQFNKLSPINFRKIFGVEKGLNPKGLALFLSGICRSSDGELNQYSNHLFELLLSSAVETENSMGWGYNFDWQNRVFYIPEGTPTVVNTAFAAHALVDFYEGYNDERVLSCLPKVANFFLQDLNIAEVGNTSCFSYTPIDNAKVHNANLLAAGALARLNRYCSLPQLKSYMSRATAYSLSGQRSDGAWVYGSDAVQQWVDSFHTGFNLEALRHIEASGLYDDKESLQHSITLGERYYVKNFFGPEGEPYYYDVKKYPYDIHTPAQALSYLSSFPEYASLVNKIIRWTFDNMYDGKFYYRVNRTHVNRISYLRWGEAWMFYGLCSVLGRSGK